MKKRSLVILAVVLVLALSFALVACGGDPLVAPNANIEAVEFTRGMTLESIALPEGFSWKDAKTPVTIGKVEYDATYTYGDESVDVKLPVEVKPTKSMLEEDETVAFIEKTLKGDDYKKGGAMYEDTFYDQFVMILARSNKGLDATIKANYLARVKDVVLPLVDEKTNIAKKVVASEWGSSTIDYTTNTVLTLLAMGENTVVDGIDLAAPFYDETFAVASFAYTLNNNLNVVRNLTIPAKYKTKDGVEHNSTTTVDKVVNALLATQKEGGSWEADELDPSTWQPTGNKIFDVDSATMAIMSMAGLNNANIAAANTAVTNDIKANILESGSIKYFGADNISGSATTISALASIGVDAASIKNATSNKSLMDYMASQRIVEGDSKGAYVSAFSAGFADNFSTKDAAIALINYNSYLRGEASFYAFK